MKKHSGKIIGKQIYLKKLSVKNASEKYASWLNDKEVNKFLQTRETTVSELKKYIKKHLDDPNSLFLGIFDKNNDVHIGNVKLEPIDWQRGRAIFGILVGDKNYWGKGVGTEVTRLVVDYGFNKLGLFEMELGVVANNVRAVHVYEKVGFKPVRIKKGIKYGDILCDEIIMIIKNDYKKK
jgi:RimJ/RimL family protein N-acetyltransferase